MGNHVIHVYDGVDIEVVWDTVQEDRPRLLDMLTEIMDEKPR